MNLLFLLPMVFGRKREVLHLPSEHAFRIQPRTGSNSTCRTDLQLSNDTNTAAMLMRRYGPDGYLLEIEGSEVLSVLAIHKGGCVYEAPYRVTRPGRFHVTVVSLYRHTGSGVDERTLEWHPTDYSPIWAQWVTLEARRSHLASSCSPPGRWVWPHVTASAYLPVPTGLCRSRGAQCKRQWVVNASAYEWRRYPECNEPGTPLSWVEPGRFSKCLARLNKPTLWLGDSQMRTMLTGSALLDEAGAIGDQLKLCSLEAAMVPVGGAAPHRRPSADVGPSVRYSCDIASCSSRNPNPNPKDMQLLEPRRVIQYWPWGMNLYDKKTKEGWPIETLPWCDPAGFGAVVLNVGQHFMSAGKVGTPGSSHGTLRHYRGVVQALAASVHELRRARPSVLVVWVETVCIPLRTDAFVRLHRDWRTPARVDAYNRLATPLMRQAGAVVVPAASVVCPMVETSPDNAHPAGFAREPTLRMALAALCIVSSAHAPESIV